MSVQFWTLNIWEEVAFNIKTYHSCDVWIGSFLKQQFSYFSTAFIWCPHQGSPSSLASTIQRDVKTEKYSLEMSLVTRISFYICPTIVLQVQNIVRIDYPTL